MKARLDSDIRSTTEYLERRREIGDAPWKRAAFQYVAAHAGSSTTSSVGYAGRDFDVPASPADTLAWFERTGRIGPLDDVQRQRALAELVSIEDTRRRKVVEILDRLVGASGSSPRMLNPPFAYLIAGDQLFLVRGGEYPEVDEVIQKIREFDPALERAASMFSRR